MIYYGRLRTKAIFWYYYSTATSDRDEVCPKGSLVSVERPDNGRDFGEQGEAIIRPVNFPYLSRHVGEDRLSSWVMPLTPLETLAYHDKLGIE